MEVDVNEVNMEEDMKPISVVEIRDESMSELEEGELEDDSDDEPVKDNRITYSSTSSKKDEDILSIRAQRFGMTNARKLPEDPIVKKLHMSMGVTHKTRTEALHLYGTDNMQTQDIFLYFDDPPASVEWLTKQECNVVWLDEETCAKALLKHSIRIRGQPDTFDSDSEGEEYVNASDLRCSLPPGGVWRKGRSRAFGHNLLIRFANVSDKKELRPYIPESLKMKEKLFPDGGDESSTKIATDADESNPWAGLARQWGKYERTAKVNKLGVQDAREIIKEKEVRDNLIKKDARDLIKFNRICRLEQKLDPDKVSESRRRRGRSPYKRSWQDEDEPAPRKRLRPSPLREENLQIIVENDSYKPRTTSSERHRAKTRATAHPVKSTRDYRSDSSSSESSSSSSGDSSSSSSDDSSSSSSSSEDEDDDEPAPPVKAPLKTPWNKTTNKFKPESSLLIEIDNDHYRKKRSND